MFSGPLMTSTDDEFGDDFDDTYCSADEYYNDSVNASKASVSNLDPEFVDFSCCDIAQIKSLFANNILKLSEQLEIDLSLSKFLLCFNNWDQDRIICEYRRDHLKFLVKNNLFIDDKSASSSHSSSKECAVCWNSFDEKIHLQCGHDFCRHCWLNHLETQINSGISIRIQCMNVGCMLICPEIFSLELLHIKPEIRAKYEDLVFRDCVESHPHIRWCPGSINFTGCTSIIFCNTNKAHGVLCSNCGTKFCIKCGRNYHAPSSCEIIKKWQTKCADDSETANYISANTKDCPNCHSCIEKNGGCNHMQCIKCKHHFCWMCFRDWKTHGNEYYECSRYKENPAIAQEANHLKGFFCKTYKPLKYILARRALERYLHYYERYENHSKSLKLEEDLRTKIKDKIDEKVSKHEGTWIDWQYLHDAAILLTKCRCTLQYTYPLAYYMENDHRKELFEFQQSQLEKEIEELSWKVERAEHTDRGDLENQMYIAELKRRTLLQDFFT